LSTRGYKRERNVTFHYDGKARNIFFSQSLSKVLKLENGAHLEYPTYV